MVKYLFIGATLVCVGPVFLLGTDYYDDAMFYSIWLVLATILILFLGLMGFRGAASEKGVLVGIGIGILGFIVALIPAVALNVIVPHDFQKMLGDGTMIGLSVVFLIVSLGGVWLLTDRYLPNTTRPFSGLLAALLTAAVPTLGVIGFAWFGFADAEDTPCAQTAWGEADSSYRIRVLFDRDECLTLSDHYNSFATLGESTGIALTPSSVAPLNMAQLYLILEALPARLRREQLDAIIEAQSSAFPDISLSNTLVQVQIAEHTLLHSEQSGLGGYMLGGTGVLVMNGAKGVLFQRISKNIGKGLVPTDAEARLHAGLVTWDRILTDMKVDGRPAELVVLKNGWYAVSALKAPRHSINERNIAIMNLKGETRTINSDYLALLVLPPLIIDLLLPKELRR